MTTSPTSQDYGQAMEERWIMDKLSECERILNNETMLLPSKSHLEACLTHIKYLNERIWELERECQFKGEGDLI